MKRNKRIIGLFILVLIMSLALLGCQEKDKEASIKEKVEKAYEEKKISIALSDLVKVPYDKAWLVYPTTDAKNHPEGFKEIAPKEVVRVFLQKDGKALEPVEFEGVEFIYPPSVTIPYLELWHHPQFTVGKKGDTPTLQLIIVDEC